MENVIIGFYLTEEKLTFTVDDVFQDWIQYESEHAYHSMKTINEYTNEYKRFIPSTVFKQANTENSPQIFKHSEAQLLKEALRDTDKLVQGQLGHSDIETHFGRIIMIYTILKKESRF